MLLSGLSWRGLLTERKLVDAYAQCLTLTMQPLPCIQELVAAP